MNAAFLIMSTAALAGADPVPAAAAPPAPIVISGAGGCSNCGTPVTDCGGCKPSFLDKLKAKFAKKSHDCGCAPAPVCTPAPACAPAPCHSCPSSIADRPNLFDKLKSRWASKKHGPCCDPCGATTVSGCATPLPAGAAPVTPGTGTPPKVMPKPADTKPVDPKPVDPKPKGGNTSGIPAPLPAVPAVNGAGLTGTSPY